MDGFVTELVTTGYMHNHARMWFASYVIHWRRVRWQAAAKFFLTHLLDGDPASNNLSFQWVASTFGAKPYLFNRENLEKYTDGKYCRGCARAGDCPFGKSYEQIDQELFQ
jgi:deoxyribodipyrimidine photo-lyase